MGKRSGLYPQVRGRRRGPGVLSWAGPLLAATIRAPGLGAALSSGADAGQLALPILSGLALFPLAVAARRRRAELTWLGI
jgi:ABC-type proline/glycine betaine transport system permease subunit